MWQAKWSEKAHVLQLLIVMQLMHGLIVLFRSVAPQRPMLALFSDGLPLFARTIQRFSLRVSSSLNRQLPPNHCQTLPCKRHRNTELGRAMVLACPF